MAFGPLGLSHREFLELTPFELNELIEGWQWRDEYTQRIAAAFVANLMNMWTKRRVTVNKLVGPPRFTRTREPERALRPGQPGWDEFLQKFPESVRRQHADSR